jgi:alpha-L-fucosidase 2
MKIDEENLEIMSKNFTSIKIRSVEIEMRHCLISKKPTSSFGNMWKEATPLGNGIIGALIYGGIKEETVLINRHDLWHWGKEMELPDVHQTLEQSRKAMDEGNFALANTLLTETLKKEGYYGAEAKPFPLGALKMSIGKESMFKHYTKSLNMQQGELQIHYDLEGSHFVRKSSVSRADNVLVYQIESSNASFDMNVSMQLHDTHKSDTERMRQEIKNSYFSYTSDGFIQYRFKNDDDTDIGAVVKVICADGIIKESTSELIVENSKKVMVILKTFSNETYENALMKLKQEINALEPSYNELLSSHIRLHQPLYESCDICLADVSSEKYGWTNEELINCAYDDEMPPVLMEKLWHFGRYLFISGASKTSNPFSLYGLWNGEYEPVWAQNVANENVQMIYWHLETGGLSQLIEPLIHYYYRKIPKMQINAKHLFGCKGIFLSTYSTPQNTYVTPIVPVITNWIGGAGWIAQHFYNYFKFTRNRSLLESEILPFMVEAADFYEAYAQYNQEGKMLIYPSVSPENSPKNFMPEDAIIHLGHPMPTVYNATMDFAIIKELLNNLITVCKSLNFYKDKVGVWEKMKDSIPEYQINEEGAIKEWLHEQMQDQYCHRHISHLYPVFPGSEITSSNNSELMHAFEKALDLRELGGQVGWSLAHMASIYCRFKRAEDAMKCMDLIAKGVLLNNFLTTSNDYRSMGITMDVGQFSPVQLDANMGVVNAIQEMLLYTNDDEIHFLPACPNRLEFGSVVDFHFPQGKVSFEWHITNHFFKATIQYEHNCDLKIILPEFARQPEISINRFNS